MAIDDGLDDAGGSPGGGEAVEVTDQGGDTVAVSDGSGGGESGAADPELDPGTEHERAEGEFAALQAEADQPDPGGDGYPDGPDAVSPDEEETEPTKVRVAELQGELEGFDEQHAEVEEFLVDRSDVDAYEEEPSKPIVDEEPGPIRTLGTIGLVAATLGKAAGDKWGEWRSTKDAGDQEAGDQDPADQVAADDPDDDRPRS